MPVEDLLCSILGQCPQLFLRHQDWPGDGMVTGELRRKNGHGGRGNSTMVQKRLLRRRGNPPLVRNPGDEVPDVTNKLNQPSSDDSTPREQSQKRDSTLPLPINEATPDAVSKPVGHFIHVTQEMVLEGERRVMEFKPADVTVLDIDDLGEAETLQWVNQARTLAHLESGFITPTIVVVGDPTRRSVVDMLRIKREVTEAGAVFYEKPEECTSIQQVLDYIKTRHQKIYEHFGTSEADFLYGPASEPESRKEVYGKHSGRLATASALSFYSKSLLT